MQFSTQWEKSFLSIQSQASFICIYACSSKNLPIYYATAIHCLGLRSAETKDILKRHTRPFHANLHSLIEYQGAILNIKFKCGCTSWLVDRKRRPLQFFRQDKAGLRCLYKTTNSGGVTNRETPTNYYYY